MYTYVLYSKHSFSTFILVKQIYLLFIYILNPYFSNYLLQFKRELLTGLIVDFIVSQEVDNIYMSVASVLTLHAELITKEILPPL